MKETGLPSPGCQYINPTESPVFSEMQGALCSQHGQWGGNSMH